MNSHQHKTRVILLHGKNANPAKKWYPWLKEQMKKCGVPCSIPALPHPNDPYLQEWMVSLDKTHPNEESILIGHSRGGVTILRWLEKQPKCFKVKKVILVAVNAGNEFDQHFSENAQTFFSKKGYDFKKIKAHCDQFVVLHSTDDKTVPFSAAEENACGLHAKFYRFTDRGHFGHQLAKQEIPELLDEIIKESE